MCCNEEGYDGAITQEAVLFVGLHTAQRHHCTARDVMLALIRSLLSCFTPEARHGFLQKQAVLAEVWPTCGIAAMPRQLVSAYVNADVEALVVQCFLHTSTCTLSLRNFPGTRPFYPL